MRRRHSPAPTRVAPSYPGARTFPLIALAGAVAGHLGTPVVTAGLVGVTALILAWYWVRAHAPRPDAGTTTAFAALVAFLLGALAWHHPSLAVGLGVIVLVLLAVNTPCTNSPNA